jgi:hypothetical protein
LLAVLAAGLVLGGCGEREIEPPLDDVVLTIDGPAERVGVNGGAFETSVALDAGTNVIDVQAGAPKHPAAMTALRVTRIVKVEIPDLEGSDPQDAADALSDLGLVPELRFTGSLLDDILGGDPLVCATTPSAGIEVTAGTTVTVDFARSC